MFGTSTSPRRTATTHWCSRCRASSSRGCWRKGGRTRCARCIRTIRNSIRSGTICGTGGRGMRGCGSTICCSASRWRGSSGRRRRTARCAAKMARATTRRGGSSWTSSVALAGRLDEVRHQLESPGNQAVKLGVEDEAGVGVAALADAGGQQRAAQRGFSGVIEGQKGVVGGVPVGGEIEAALLLPARPSGRLCLVRRGQKRMVEQVHVDGGGRIGDAPAKRGRADDEATRRGAGGV